MRNMAEYRVSAKCTDDLISADAEIRVRVFKKTSLTILLKGCQFNRLSMKNRYGTEIHGKKQPSLFFQQSKWGTLATRALIEHKKSGSPYQNRIVLWDQFSRESVQRVS
jgi:hypothetical protein